ncbi:MAG: phosphoenolpyruvate carboxylase [Betaproteobacteria bacterium]|nr:phosphoenolpyruvate carboxylase [Betaproteobacteria bacterium]
MHALAGSPPQRGSLAGAFATLASGGVGAEAIVAWCEGARVSPVLTAHPTEVQRKSILDAERGIAELVAMRDRMALSPAERREVEVRLHRRVLGLWQTAMLRLSRLQVVDEIENGLAYYRYTFLAELPRLYADLAASLGQRALDGRRLAPFLRMGSWIGGDRDGNPFVTAQTLVHAVRAQAGVAFGHYLDEVHRLGGELSLSSRLVRPTPALLGLAAAAHDANPHRQDEPYRQALIGVYARIAATAQRKSNVTLPARTARRDAALRGARGVRRRPRDDRRFARDARRGRARRGAARAAALRGGRVRIPPRVARPAPERRRARGGRRRDAREERGRRGLCGAGRACARRAARRRAREPASGAKPVRRLFGARARRARDRRRGRGRPCRLRRRGHPPLRDLQVPVGLGPARGRGAAQGGRARARRPFRARHRAAVRDDRRPRARRPDHARGVRAARVAAARRRTRRPAGGDAGLLGQQQGRRLPRGELGALPGRAGPRRGVRRRRRHARALPRPRRHRRPRGRPLVRRDPRAAARQRARGTAAHRAGRDHREQVLGSRARPAQPRDARRGGTGGGPVGRRAAGRPRGCLLPGARRALGARALLLPGARLRDARVRRLLPRVDADRRDRRSQHRQPSRVAHRLDAHRGPARDSLGVQLEPVPADASRLVRRGQRRRRVASGASGRDAAAARNARALAVLRERALEHGDGALEDRPRRRVPLREHGGGRGAARSRVLAHRRRARAHARGAGRDHRACAPAGRQPDARAQPAQPRPVPRPPQPPADRAPDPLPGRPDRRAHAPRDPHDDQRAGGGPPEQRMTAAGPGAASTSLIWIKRESFALLLTSTRAAARVGTSPQSPPTDP